MRPQLASVQLLAISAVALAVLFAPISIAEELPPEIQVDRLLVQAEREIKDGENWSAVIRADSGRREEHGLNIPAEFWFRQAGVLHSSSTRVPLRRPPATFKKPDRTERTIRRLWNSCSRSRAGGTGGGTGQGGG